MTILEILNQLEATRSKNEKQRILESHIDNQDLKEFFRLALDPFINFYQKKDFDVARLPVTKVTLAQGMGYLRAFISTRAITGNEAISGIIDTLEQMTQDDADVMRRILKKDPACGVDTTALKVWPKLYREYPVMLSEAFDQKYWDKYFDGKGPWIVNLKSDGGRANIIVRNGVVSVMSRAGNELNLHGRFDFIATAIDNVMIDGELVAHKAGKAESRKYSNGIFTKAVRGTISTEEAMMMHLVVWDMIPLDVFDGDTTSKPYHERFDDVQKNVKVFRESGRWDAISVIENKIVYTQDEAMEFYLEMRERGEEGAMLKTLTHKWSSVRSKEVLKLKNIGTADLVVVGAEEGKGALANNLGALVLETSCGKLSVNSSGFPLKLRSEIWANITGNPVKFSVAVDDGQFEYFWAYPGDCTITIGSIVEIKYNEVIDDKRTGKHSLFLPRFSQERLDKKTANSLEEIKCA